MKLNRKTIGALIFIFLILLLFFSKTIYTYNMPEVSGTRPRRGSLSKLEISSGVAGWAETETIYSASSGVVGNVYVREGDVVEAGQILFEMNFDAASAERRLAEIENNIAKLEADIRAQMSRLNNIREALEAASLETDSERQYSGQTGLIIMEINRAKALVQNARLSFEYGLQSRNELTDAENNLLSLFYRYESEANDLEHSIFMKQLDLENLKFTRDSAGETLRDYRNNAVITAPVNGTIHELSAERGRYFPENAFLVSIGIGNEFTIECTISLDNNFVNPGGRCEVSNASHTLFGTVRRVRPSAHGKTVTITVVSDEINDGETFTITFENVSNSPFTLVPNSAINQDNDGYFLYQIKRRRGIMGEEYYVDRLNIIPGDSDHQNTAIIRGITFFDPVVLVSNKALYPGQTVTLKNPEDFFEN